MSTASDRRADRASLEVQRLAAPVSWYAYLLPLETLPLRPERRGLLRADMDRLVARLRGGAAAQRSVFLLFDELHQDGAIREVARHGRSWRPDIGLGLLPEGAPPRYWTEKDLTDRDHGSPIPTLMHSVALLDTDEAGAQNACEVMAGTGGLIQVLHNGATSALRDAWFNTFQPTIQEEGLAAYPLYVPLLSASSLTGQGAETLDTWMGPAEIYLRESAVDKGIFLLSRSALEPALEQAGFKVSHPIVEAVN